MRDIEWLEPLIEPEPSQALKQYARQNLGVASSTLGFFASCPWVMRGMIDLLSTKRVHIDHDLTDLVALMVSRDNSCRYCYAASRMILRLLGMSEERIRRLEQDLEMAQLDARTKLALDFAARISRSNPSPTQADKKALLDLDYPTHLWLEKEIKSVANVARRDVREFLELAASIPIKPEVQEFRLEDANKALIELKERKIRGAKVLKI